MSELVIIRGLPGSGKSTIARNSYPDYLHYEPDHFFCDNRGTYRFDAQIYEEALKWTLLMVDLALARGENVVISDVFCKKQDIEPFVEIAKMHKAPVSLLTLTKSFDNCHRVPVFVLKKMRDSFQNKIDSDGYVRNIE